MITIEQVKAANWSVLHIDGSGYWQNRMVCAEFPRLCVIDEEPARARSKVQLSRRFIVDGRTFHVFADAIAALNQPPPEEAP